MATLTDVGRSHGVPAPAAGGQASARRSRPIVPTKGIEFLSFRVDMFVR